MYGRFSTAIIMEVAYGYHVKSKDDKYVVMMSKLNDMLDTLAQAKVLAILPWSKSDRGRDMYDIS